MHLVMIGDIGPVDNMIHIGDEAMFDEAARQLRRRGVERITAISSNPADTVDRYGVSAVLRLSRGGSAEELSALIADSDGVLVTGGGNISSVWPSHIVERAGLARMAEEHGRPFVLSGQTIGPVLSPADRETVAWMLRSATLVGTREAASASLVARLGVDAERTRQTADDASFLIDGRETSSPPLAEPYALVTIARHVGDADPELAAAAYARLLDTAVEQTGLELVFHAHFASMHGAETNAGDVRGDSAVHAAIAARLRTSRFRVAPTTDVPSSARLARDADLVISSRYHPAVFAGPGGVPTIGIPVDEYTEVKLRGALGSFGQGADGHGALLSLSNLLQAGGGDTVKNVWGAREQTHERGIRLADESRPISEAWWDRVRAAF
jgi:polysaccharide pyruvyl transferase WcaK-like protein